MKVPAPNQILPASPSLVELARKHARSLGIACHEGTVVSEDAFYQSLYQPATLVKKTKALAVEMEAFGLYANAAKLRRLALTLLTVSDSLITKESMSAADRQSSLSDMVKLALEMGASL